MPAQGRFDEATTSMPAENVARPLVRLEIACSQCVYFRTSFSAPAAV